MNNDGEVKDDEEAMWRVVDDEEETANFRTRLGSGGRGGDDVENEEE